MHLSKHHNSDEAASVVSGSSRNSHNKSLASTTSSWNLVGPDTLVLKPSSLLARKKTGHSFTVDHVFDEDRDTKSIYQEMGRPIVQSALTGRNGTLFAYGQTGSGKTFTLQGNSADHSQDENDEEQEHKEGLIQLAMTDLFDAIHASTSRQWEVKVQYFEIYNEVVQDLIAATPPVESSPHSTVTTSSSSVSSSTPLWNSRVDQANRTTRRSLKQRSSSAPPRPVKPVVRLPTLKIVDHGNGVVHVNAREQVVTSAAECVRLLRKGNRARAMAATDANQHSSRSHAIFRVSLQSRPASESTTGQGTAPSRQLNEPSTTIAATWRWSVLNFVDLAGSENSRKALGSSAAAASDATSISSYSSARSSLHRKQREGGKINQGLLSLSRVIYALSLPEAKRPSHIGFRDSKLTRILQPSLSGNAAMAILCCVSLAKADIGETKSSLQFATSAKRIPIQPIVNEVLFGPNSSAKERAEQKAAFIELQNEMRTVKQALKEFQERFAQQQQAQQQDASSSITKPQGPSSALIVGRLAPAGSTTNFSILDSSMGSSEETPTLSPPVENSNLLKDKPNASPEDPPLPSLSQSSTSNSLVVVHTPLSSSPLSPPLLPRQQQRGEEPHLQLAQQTPQEASSDDEDHHFVGPPPPLTEVEISPQDNGKLAVATLDEQRANYLEERLEMTEALVERMYTELNITRHAVMESSARNAELQELVVQMQRQIVDEEEEEDASTGRGLSSFSGWCILICILLYAFGLRDFFISGIIFLWLSLQVLK